MAAFLLLRRSPPIPPLILTRSTCTYSFTHSRHPDPTFEKFMSTYKHYLKVLALQDLILSSPSLSLPLAALAPHPTAQRLRLTKGAPHFIRTYPHIFTLSPSPPPLGPAAVGLTSSASRMSSEESVAADATVEEAVDRVVRVLMMSRARAVPMRAVFRVWRELGLPDEFEERVLRGKGEGVFRVRDNPKERNTHILELVGDGGRWLVPKVEEWRRRRRRDGGEGLKKVDEMELRFGFKQGFPPGMRLTKSFRSKLKDWQKLPYVGPYEPSDGGFKRSKDGLKRMEKRAVGIMHEFLSLTVEKMVEVEKVSQFRKWFGIDLNIRDLFLDHPGIFYLSAKGKRHTVFLREAYEKGRLIEPNPIYDARRKLLELVAMRRRGVVAADEASMVRTRLGTVEEEEEEDGEDEDDEEEEEEEEEAY